MSQKWRVILCAVVTIAAAVSVTAIAYKRSLPDEETVVKPTDPSEKTVVGEHEEEPKELPDDTVVYVTPSGKKYHLTTSCRYLARSKTINSLTKKQATDKGLEPCSGCVE